MTTLNNTNFEFMATIGNILKTFNNNPNIELRNFKMDDFCDGITLEAYFKNGKTARQDFFGFFNSIGYMTTELNGYNTDEDYYDIEDYPNGATVIPEVVYLEFNAEIKEVVYKMQSWEVKADDSLTIPFYEL